MVYGIELKRGKLQRKGIFATKKEVGFMKKHYAKKGFNVRISKIKL
jgi:hypothetical protein